MNFQQAKESINDYVKNGVPTGGFLKAVLENNLSESMGRADESSHENLFSICEYIYCYVPMECWGSPEKVLAWLKKKSEGSKP